MNETFPPGYFDPNTPNWAEPNDFFNFNQNVFGIDPASPDGDKASLCVRVAGTTFVCALPDGIGNPTKLEVKNGRVICRTDSGITMIVPA